MPFAYGNGTPAHLKAAAEPNRKTRQKRMTAIRIPPF